MVVSKNDSNEPGDEGQSTGKRESTGKRDLAGTFQGAGAYLLVLTVLIWVAVVLLGHARFQPPAPLNAAAAGKDEFSAERADEILNTLVGDGIPHPAGSQHNKVVCQRVVDLLDGWGYDVVKQETQNKIRQQPDGNLIPLVNVMARLPGRTGGPAIMLASHYDSRTGAGASDDGVGTAALLEIARMMKERPQPRNDMIFLITDGEELGLLGADKFVEQHPWAKEVAVVINLEARGTTGPSLMFETSENSRWLIDLFAQAVERPMGSSLFYEIYKFLPNDTDFTMFRQGGMQGYNFAFIGDVKNYHTSNDNYENVDRGSLQHHGQNSWALTRELVEMDIETKINDAPKLGNAVYFDVLGWFIIWWPASWSLLLSAIATAALFSTVLIRRRFDSELFGRLVIAVGLVLLSMAACGLLVWLVSSAFSLDPRFENPWIESPIPVELAFWLAATTCAAIMVNFLPPLRDFQTAWMATMFVWCGLSFATSYFLVGVSYLFLAPVVVASLAGLLLSWRRQTFQFALLVFATVVAFLWLPNERLFYDAVGFSMNIVLAIRIAIVITAFLPVLSHTGPRERAAFGWLSFVGFLAAVIVAIFLNPVS